MKVKDNPFYLKHKGYIKRKNKAKHKSFRGWMNLFKHKPCFDCGGWFEPCQMDFDHRPGEKKLFEVGTRVTTDKTSLYREIKKCDLVCANCHRLRTFMRKSLTNRRLI